MSATDDSQPSPEPEPEPSPTPDSEEESGSEEEVESEEEAEPESVVVDVGTGSEDDDGLTVDDVQALIGDKSDTLDIHDKTLSGAEDSVIEALREDMHKQALALAELEKKHQYEQLHRSHSSHSVHRSDDSSSISGCSPRSRSSPREREEKIKIKRIKAEEKAKKHAEERARKAKKEEKEEEKRAQKTEKEENEKKERKFENFIWWDKSERLAEKEKDKNKWSTLTRYRFQRCLWKLKYNRIVSTFYLENLKRREGRWSWMIIVISTFTSGLTVANNVEDEPVDQYNTYVNASLTVSSMTVSLIAAWIKKQMFIERINETDKYLLNINALCEELEIQFALLNRDRIKYDDFKKKYIPEITKYLTTNPMIPPNEWKSCIREITQKYPELVNPDNTQENKLWPWFGDYVLDTDDYGKESVVRNPTTFMEHFKKSQADRLKSSCCARICKPKAITNIY
tara:strand:- start:187 stop:1551 length:1365 start_codon:yes stop_codon:yes gene_type:complete